MISLCYIVNAIVMSVNESSRRAVRMGRFWKKLALQLDLATGHIIL